MHQITVGIRNVGKHVIVIGSMTSDSGFFPDARSVNMSTFFGNITGSDSFDLEINNDLKAPVEDGYFYKSIGLSEMATVEVWRGFKSFSDLSFGGSIALLDSLYLPSEDSSVINRKLFLAIFEAGSMPLFSDSHSVFNGQLKSSDSSSIVFSLKKDTESDISDSFSGEALQGILRALVFKNAEGVKFTISSDMPKISRDIHKAAYLDIINTGAISSSVESSLHDNNILSMHYKDSDYVDFLQGVSQKSDLFLKSHDFLLTLDESNERNMATSDFIKEQMSI